LWCTSLQLMKQAHPSRSRDGVDSTRSERTSATPPEQIEGHQLQTALSPSDGFYVPGFSEPTVSCAGLPTAAPWTIDLRRLAHALRGEIAEIGSQLTVASTHHELFRNQALHRIEKLEETIVPDFSRGLEHVEETEPEQTSDLNSQFDVKMEELRAELEAHRSNVDKANQEICSRLDTRDIKMDDLIVKVTADLESVALGDVISTADLHCRQLTRSSHINKASLQDSLKEIVRVENMYSVRGNVWDAILLLGIDIIPMGVTGMMLMVASILANVFIQLVICYFVCMLAYTRDGQLDESLINDALLWRADVSSEMAERVCDHDFSLSVNSLQSQTHELYSNYFNEFSYILCCFMLIVWTLTIVREVNMVSHLLKAILMSRQERRTVMEIHMYRIYLVSVGIVKRRLIVVTCCIQFIICGLLLFAGATWLSATETPEELLLNSVALAYVLEVDEVLYQIMCPPKIRAIIAQMQPLEYAPLDERCSQHARLVFRICQPVAILVIMFVSFFWRVNTRMGDMQRLLDALCA